MKMKKFLSAILSLTLLAGILSVIPISAEAVFISNMSGWRKVTGSWDFSTGRAQSTTSNNQAVCSTSVDKSDNWMWNTDISYADTSTTVPYYYLRFGYQSDSGPYYYLQIGPTATSNQVAFYYYNGSANSRISGWASFPTSSDTSAFNVRISYTNGYFDAYIDDVFVVRCADDQSKVYNGGYFGLANNKIISYFNNVNLYVYNEPIETYAGNFSTSRNGYKTLTATQKWNQAYISSPAVGKYLKIDTNYKFISGNNQSYIRFGLKDDSNYFSLNMQPGDAGGNAFAVYEMLNGTNTRRSKWVSGPDGYNKSEFSIKIDVTPETCNVYIDGELIITCNITYNGGKLGLATYYTASQFNDLTVIKSVDNKITFTAGRLAVDNNDGSISYLDTGWGSSTIGLKSNSDFEISMDIKNGSGNQQYFLYFGTSSNNADSITDGYSVRMALADTNGEANIVVYDEATKTRVSPSWQPFPESSDRSSFTITVKYLNGIARVFIDGIHILITEKLTPSGTFTYFKTNRTSVDVSGLWATVPETLIGDVNADGIVSALDLAKLRKKLLNESEIIDETAANCNTDVGISILDLVRLKKLLSGVISAFNGYTPTTADGCGYSANGAFKLYNTSSDFDSEKPYVYMLKNGSSIGITDVIYETKMGVYSTSDYTVEEVGYIIADGNHALNQSAMTVDSDVLPVTVASFAETGDYNEFKIYVSGVGNNVSKTVRGYIKTTDSEGNTEYFYSSNCCFFALTESN